MLHRRSALRSIVALAVLLWPAVASLADDWPQFRGPNRDGISRETGLLETWPEPGPPELWRVKLGAGFSGVSAVGQRLYTMDSRGEKEYVVCLDASDGRELWRAEVGPLFREATGDGPRSTPTVEGGMVYAIGSLGNLVALRLDDGSRAWSVSIPERFGTPPQLFGFTMSPLVAGEHLVIETGAAGGDAVAAFDKKTGKLVWQTAIGGPMANTSPIHVPGPGPEQLLFLNLENLFSLSTHGELLWSIPFGPEVPQKVPSPVFIEPDLVLVSTSYEVGSMVVRMSPGGEGGPAVLAEPAWQSLEMRNNIGTSLAVEGLLCGFDNATLKCLDAATGEALWAKRGGFGKGSLISADHHLLVLTERGRVLWVEVSREAYLEKAAMQLMAERTWTPPSLAHGRLYVRASEELVALDLRAGETAIAHANGPDAQTGDAPANAAKALPATLDAEAIVDRHLEALGADALGKIETIRVSGRFFSNGIEYPFVRYQKRPNLYRYEVRQPDGRESIEAYDGKVGWQDKIPIWRPGVTEYDLTPLGEILAHRLAFILEDEADFGGPLVDYEKKGNKVKLVGVEDLGDGSAYHLVVTLASGNSQHFYLDQGDFRIVKRTNTHADAMGYHPRSHRTRFYSAYRRVAGVLFPIAWEHEEPPTLATFEVDKIEVNIDIDPGIFSLPKSGSADGM